MFEKQKQQQKNPGVTETHKDKYWRRSLDQSRTILKDRSGSRLGSWQD